MDKISTQALRVMESLEIHSGVYDLKINNIPIWWVIRVRFYGILLDHLRRNEKKEIILKDNTGSDKKSIITSCRKGIVFILRCFKSLVIVTINSSPKEPILFFAYSSGFKEDEDRKKTDVFIDPIYQKLNGKAVIIERPTLRGLDFQSFLYRKNVIFADWAILFSFFKNFFKICSTKKIENWEIFENKCKEIDLEISSDWVIETIEKLTSSLTKKIIIQVGAAEIILKKIKPKVVVETTSYDSGTVAINLIARKQNIPVIELQHGVITKKHKGYACFLPSNYSEVKPLPNKILVYGEAFKNAVLATGNAFTPENIIITGFPRLNNFLRKIQTKREFIRKRIRKKIGIWENNFLVTITSKSSSNNYLSQFFEEVALLLKENTIICIKLHPSEVDSGKLIYRNISSYPQIKIVDDNIINLYDLLVASDVHVTVGSTVFLECLALGVPNIILRKPSYNSILELVDCNKVISIATPKDFIEELNKLKKDEQFRKMIIEEGKEISRYFFAKETYAEELIVKEIKKYLN